MKQINTLNPAFDIVYKIGGVKIVADLLGINTQQVYKWFKPKSKGGTGGSIPPKHHIKLLEHCKENRLGINLADFKNKGTK